MPINRRCRPGSASDNDHRCRSGLAARAGSLRQGV